MKSIRILVAIDHRGKWVCAGYDTGAHNTPDPHDWIIIDDLSEHMAYHWIEAEVPIPAETTITGSLLAEQPAEVDPRISAILPVLKDWEGSEANDRMAVEILDALDDLKDPT